MNCRNRGCYYNFYGTCNAFHKLDISKDGECMTKTQITNSVDESVTILNIDLPYTNNTTTKIGGYNE